MFGLGFAEIVIIAILALLLLGPDRLPEAAKMLGKTIQDLKKATDGLKTSGAAAAPFQPFSRVGSARPVLVLSASVTESFPSWIV